MKRKVLSLTILALALSLSVPRAWANHGGGYGGRGGHDLGAKFFWKAHMLMENKEALGLSADQADAIHQLKIDVKKEWLRQSAEIEIAEIDIMSALKTEKPDVDAVNQLIDKKYELKKALSKTIVSSLVKLKSTLDQKQWDAFKKLKEDGKKGTCSRCQGMKHGS